MGILCLFAALGSFGGFVSGLLGVGGAVIMIPLMLSLPPLFGFAQLSMQDVSGLSIVNVLVSSASGLLVHRRNRRVDRRALFLIGPSMAAGALAGAYCSRFVPESGLLAAFAALATAAAIVLLRRPLPDEIAEGRARAETKFIPAVCVGTTVGLLSGLTGAGGGFVLIPLMVYLLGIPLRLAIGTSLGIVFMGSVSGAAGKVLVGAVDWKLALALSFGAVLSSRFGARLSGALPARLLRLSLFAVVAASCVQAWSRLIAVSLR